MKNTYITYDKLLSLVNDYFRMTGWEDFLSKWTLEIIINLSIQDILNQTWYSYMIEFEIVKDHKIDNWYKVFELKYPINMVHEILKDWTWESMEIVSKMPELDKDQIFFRKWTNLIYTNSDVEFLTVQYERAYEYQVLWNNEHRDKTIPIPFTYVPALIKVIYDTSSVFTYFQWDWQYADFWWHAQSRLGTLIPQDKLSYNEKVKL